MNPTNLSYNEMAPAASQAPARYRGAYEWLVVRNLQKYRHGALRMTWPDGATQQLGDPEAAPTAEIRIRHSDFFRQCALFGNVGLGEAYMHGDWETDDIKAVISWFILNITQVQGAQASSTRLGGANLLRLYNRILHRLRPNSLANSRRNISAHYDLGNNFYSLWLDETMTYSAARFDHQGQPLADAQRAKYDALCQKLHLTATDRVLEIGCGWGGFCTYAARQYGCHVTAVTISEEQFRYATDRVLREGLQDRVEIRLQDYRHITGQFDKIASIEMLEAVGAEYLDTWFAKCHELLTPEGLLAVQTITTPDCRYRSLRQGVDWIQKHIFPGSLLLSVGRLNEAANHTGDLFLHAMEDLGSSYVRTLRHWHDRFTDRVTEVSQLGFDETFIRKWRFYLQYCEAAFATRNITVIQAVYTRPNNTSLHRSW